MSSTFNFAQYQQIAAQEQSQSSGDGTKVGYFKLKDDGDIAIARINLASTDEFMFAAVHTLSVGGKWMKVSCLNPLGMNAAGCPLCSANHANPKGSVGKSAKKMFIPMLVSYRDPNSTTGYTPVTPVIWDRPAAFSRELANKLMVAGNLKDVLVLITRNGKAGDMQTTYSVDVLPANHPVFKPDMIPADFSAFNNFNIAKHSYWEKTAEEINTFLATGQFPERAQNNNQQAVNTMANTATTYAAPATPAYTAPAQVAPTQTVPAYTTTAAPQYTAPVNTANAAIPNAEAPVAPATPVRNFSGFSF
jgi:hypothetical protein